MRRLLVLAALLALSLVVAALPGLLDPERTPPADRGALTPAQGAGSARETGCRDLLVVGVDGHGERPAARKALGRTLSPAAAVIGKRSRAAGLSVEVRRTAVATSGPRQLLRTPRATGRSNAAVTRPRVRAWIRTVAPRGVRAVIGDLRAAVQRCPAQHLVVIGHGQGAAAAHRALLRVRRKQPAVWARVAGVLLIGDPDRAVTTGQQLVGAPPAPRTGRGATATRLTAVAPVPSAAGVWHVCTLGDLVCDLRGNRVDVGVRRATSYHRGAGRTAVRRAARGIAAQVRGRVAADPPTTPRLPARAITAGGQSTCEIRVDAGVWCWGDNAHGQLGDGTTTTRTRPARIGGTATWAQLRTSGVTTCGVRTEGTLWCWGLNNRGQLGNGARSNAAVPPTQVTDNTTWTAVSTGWWHTCALRANGTLWCWGRDDRAQLGLGGVQEQRTRPQRVDPEGPRDFVAVSVGGLHTCAVRADASLWCWGAGIDGQLGLGDRERRVVPTRVAADRDWLEVTASWGHTCALSTAGEAWCWGVGDLGQLGDGAAASTLVPVRVAGEQAWTTLALGDGHSCGIDVEDNAWCWGEGRYGQLGDGQRSRRPVPALVAGGASTATMVAGWFHTCAVDTAGVSRCWGENGLGQVGDGTTTNRVVPGGGG